MIEVNFQSEVDNELALEILGEIRNDEMGGWFLLPSKYNKEEFLRIKEAAKKKEQELFLIS